MPPTPPGPAPGGGQCEAPSQPGPGLPDTALRSSCLGRPQRSKPHSGTARRLREAENCGRLTDVGHRSCPRRPGTGPQAPCSFTSAPPAGSLLWAFRALSSPPTQHSSGAAPLNSGGHFLC